MLAAAPFPCSSLLRSLALAALLAPLPGADCSADPPPSPCDLDRLGCEDTEPDVFYLPNCPAELTGGTLDVQVGHGETAFTPFGEGTGPVVNYGPQGGQHAFMGVRVGNARLDVSPLLRLKFYLGQGDACDVPADGSLAFPACSVTIGQRDLVLGSGGFDINVTPDGAVEEFGLVVFIEVPTSTLTGVVAVSVEDQCRRSGASFQRWTKY